MNIKDLKIRSTKSVSWLTIQKIGNQVIFLIVFIYLARLLEPSAFGIIALAEVFLNYVRVFLDKGISVAIVQRDDLKEGHLDTAFWINLGFAVFLTALTILFSGKISVFLKEPLLSPILRLLSLTIILGSFRSIQQAILYRKLQYKFIAISSLIAWIAGGVVGLVLAFLNYGIYSIVYMQLVRTIIETILLWILSEWIPRFSITKQYFKEIFIFGFNITLLNMLNFFNLKIIDLIIGYYLGAEILGYYSIVQRIFQMLTEFIINTLNSISIPLFSRLQVKKPIITFHNCPYL